MSDIPVFIYGATYASYDDCLADYELLLEAHAAKLVGTYDVALIRKDNEGKIHVEKHEKPTQHGAWGGIAVGALVGVLFAPLVLGAAAVDADAKALERELKESERIYRPGETVPVSDIYNVVGLHGTYQGRQVTGEAGRTFEPTRHGTAEYGYVLYRQTMHLGA